MQQQRRWGSYTAPQGGPTDCPGNPGLENVVPRREERHAEGRCAFRGENMFLKRWRIARLIDEDDSEAAARQFGEAAIEPLLIHFLSTDALHQQSADLEALSSIPGWRQSQQAKKVIPLCRKTIRKFLDKLHAGESLPTERAGDEIQRALNVLAMVREKGSVPILLEMLATGKYYSLVSWALGEIRDERALPSLKDLFERTDSEYVRASCAEALVRFDRSALHTAGVDVSAAMTIARPRMVKALWDRANDIGKRMRRLENKPGGDPWALMPEMEAVLQECLRLDKTEARKLITAVKGAGLLMLDLHVLCDRLLKQTE